MRQMHRNVMIKIAFDDKGRPLACNKQVLSINFSDVHGHVVKQQTFIPRRERKISQHLMITFANKSLSQSAVFIT